MHPFPDTVSPNPVTHRIPLTGHVSGAHPLFFIPVFKVIHVHVCVCACVYVYKSSNKLSLRYPRKQKHC